MYVRHLAWLHAIPEGSKKSRIAAFKEKDSNHPNLRMPDLEKEHAASYLIGLLHEAGLMSSSGMGPVPLSWSEIESWLRVTQRELSMFDKMSIKHLSEEYVSELSQATDKNRQMPYQYVPEEVDRDAVQSKILNFVQMFKRRKDGPVEAPEEA